MTDKLPIRIFLHEFNGQFKTVIVTPVVTTQELNVTLRDKLSKAYKSNFIGFFLFASTGGGRAEKILEPNTTPFKIQQKWGNSGELNRFVFKRPEHEEDKDMYHEGYNESAVTTHAPEVNDSQNRSAWKIAATRASLTTQMLLNHTKTSVSASPRVDSVDVSGHSEPKQEAEAHHPPDTKSEQEHHNMEESVAALSIQTPETEQEQQETHHTEVKELETPPSIDLQKVTISETTVEEPQQSEITSPKQDKSFSWEVNDLKKRIFELNELKFAAVAVEDYLAAHKYKQEADVLASKLPVEELNNLAPPPPPPPAIFTLANPLAKLMSRVKGSKEAKANDLNFNEPVKSQKPRRGLNISAEELLSRRANMSSGNDNRKQQQQLEMQSVLAWVNSILERFSLQVHDLALDMQNGVMLANLLEALTESPVKHSPNPRSVAQKLDNLNSCFRVLQFQGVKVVGCTPEDFLKGNINAIMGLIVLIIKKWKNYDRAANRRFSKLIAVQKQDFNVEPTKELTVENTKQAQPDQEVKPTWMKRLEQQKTARKEARPSDDKPSEHLAGHHINTAEMLELPAVDTLSVLKELDTIVAPDTATAEESTVTQPTRGQPPPTGIELSLDSILQDLINPEDASDIVILGLPEEVRKENPVVDTEEREAYEVDLDTLLSDLASELGVANEHV